MCGLALILPSRHAVHLVRWPVKGMPYLVNIFLKVSSGACARRTCQVSSGSTALEVIAVAVPELGMFRFPDKRTSLSKGKWIILPEDIIVIDKPV